MKTELIGMLHLPALPGAPRYDGNLDRVREHVMADASALVGGGIRQLMLENFGDAPFYPGSVPSNVVAHMTSIARDVGQQFDVSLGINVLRNDGCAALAIADAVGAEFIRVNVLCGARVTDQGVVQGVAHELLRLRKRLHAEQVKILADVAVKHSAPLADLPLEQEVADLIQRGCADGVIVSGTGTGAVTDVAEVRAVKLAAEGAPVYVGSGVALDNAARCAGIADGLIVGTSLKRDGKVDNPVDPSRVRALVDAIA